MNVRFINHCRNPAQSIFQTRSKKRHIYPHYKKRRPGSKVILKILRKNVEKDFENTADAAWRRKLKWCSRDEPGNGGLFYGRRPDPGSAEIIPGVGRTGRIHVFSSDAHPERNINQNEKKAYSPIRSRMLSFFIQTDQMHRFTAVKLCGRSERRD